MGQTILTTQVPAVHNGIDGATRYTLGTLFFSDVDGQVNGIRWWAPQSAQAGRRCGLYRYDGETFGALLKAADFVTTTDDAWNLTLFDAPVPIVANQKYIAAIFTPGFYVSSGHLLDDPIVNGHLTAPAKASGQNNGRFVGDTSSTDLSYPTEEFNGTCYFVDVDFTPAGAPAAPQGIWGVSR